MPERLPHQGNLMQSRRWWLLTENQQAGAQLREWTSILGQFIPSLIKTWPWERYQQDWYSEWSVLISRQNELLFSETLLSGFKKAKKKNTMIQDETWVPETKQQSRYIHSICLSRNSSMWHHAEVLAITSGDGKRVIMNGYLIIGKPLMGTSNLMSYCPCHQEQVSWKVESRGASFSRQCINPHLILQWPQQTNMALNSFPLHPVYQIWFSQISTFSFWRNNFVGTVSVILLRWLWQWGASEHSG